MSGPYGRIAPNHAAFRREQGWDGFQRSSGRIYLLCPFHQEKTPSCVVYPEEDRPEHYYCYGCGAHGPLQDLHNTLQFPYMASKLHAKLIQLESNLNRVLEHIRESRECRPEDFVGRREAIFRHTLEAKAAFDWIDNFTVIREVEEEQPPINQNEVRQY